MGEIANMAMAAVYSELLKEVRTTERDALLAALKAFNMTAENIVGGTATTITLRVPVVVIQQAAAAIAKAEGR